MFEKGRGGFLLPGTVGGLGFFSLKTDEGSVLEVRSITAGPVVGRA